MFNFDLKKAGIYEAVRWGRWFKLVKPLNKVFLIVFILIFLIFLYGFLAEAFVKSTLSLLLGLSIIFLTLTAALRVKLLFFRSKLSKPRLKTGLKAVIANPEKYNLAEFLSFEVAEVIRKSKNNSTAIFYNLLRDYPKLNFIFNRTILNPKEIKKILKHYLRKIPTELTDAQAQDLPEFQAIILDSLKTAEKKEHPRAEIGDMFTALAKNDLIFKKILIDANLKVRDIENLTWWLENLEEEKEKSKKFWEWENLIKRGSLAKQWAAGFTPTLDRFSIDLSVVEKQKGFPEIIGHKAEIKGMERILASREINNVLVIGEPGTGKKTIIQGLTTRTFLGQSLPEINYKRIVALDIPSILSGVENRELVQSVLDTIFQETIQAGNVILVINDFHNFIRSEIQPGVIDISGVLSSYLTLPQFQLIGICTYEGLHKYIERKSEILDLFEKVEVSEISDMETLMLLEKMVPVHEQKYKRFISYPALREIINLSTRYFPILPFPKKAMRLLDETMVHISSTKDKVVLPRHVAKIVSEKTEIPVGEIEIKEREVLLNLEKLIHQRIINQEEAVIEVSTALRRARAEITIRKGPIGAFLFLGPTGVGKTETAKALTEIYFGSEDKIIRMDMSEFQNVADIPRLIGSAGEEGLLTTQVRENPFSLILLDEIEKAHPNILNLFLQVLDEGHLTDGLGRKVDFKNSIIIATSNAGYQIILKSLKEKAIWSGVKERLLDFLFAEGIFRPEFINRFDAVVVFSPLSKENLLDIAELMLQKLKKNLEQKDIDFVITQPLKEKIAELGYDPTFGAREMRRVIQDKVEDVLASALLSGKIKRGDKVEVDPEGFELKIHS